VTDKDLGNTSVIAELIDAFGDKFWKCLAYAGDIPGLCELVKLRQGGRVEGRENIPGAGIDVEDDGCTVHSQLQRDTGRKSACPRIEGGSISGTAMAAT
jgi:hypothetical protein